jgi:lipopolysaccharide export system protein LptC
MWGRNMRLAASEPAPRVAAPPAPQTGLPAFAALARRAAAVAVDRRHTRRVAVLKRVLPLVGVSLLLLIAIWPRLAPLWERMRVGLLTIDLRDARELRMINPRYSGIDREGRPFVVIAASARQIPDRQDLVSLQSPVAEMRLRSGAQVQATSVSAVYQSQAGVIDMFGDVTVTHQDGTRFVTQTARVNAAQNTAEGNDPVVGHGPAGDIKAQGFRIIDKGESIIFTGQSEMLLNSAKKGGAKKAAPERAPPSLPAAVAELAAPAATPAKPAAPRAARPSAAKGPAHARTRSSTHGSAGKKR